MVAAFRKESDDEALNSWVDSCFHLMLPHGNSGEKRFHGGLAIWIAWAVLRLARPLPPIRSFCDFLASGRSSYGFRMLPTPAHEDTLLPLISSLGSSSLVFYGHPPEHAPPEAVVDMTLPTSIRHVSRISRFSALVRSVRNAVKICGILDATDLPSYHHSKDFKARLAEQFLHYELKLSTLRLSPCRHEAVFLTYELMPDSKALVSWAKETGARVIHVMHGQRLPTYQITNATDLILLSKIDEPWFRERVGENVRIWTTGHPRLEEIRRKVGGSPRRDERKLPRIAFFSQPSEADYDREARLNDWKILSGLAGKAEVRFRLHPRENREHAIQDLAGIGAGFVTLSDEGFQQDLEWCDAVASSWSTVSLEAAACGRGIFWTDSDPSRHEASATLRSHGIGALIRGPEDWQKHLDAWITGGWDEPVVLSTPRLHELGLIGDMEKSWAERLGLHDSKTFPTNPNPSSE